MKGSILTSWWIFICLFAAYLTDPGSVNAQGSDPSALAASGDFAAAGYAYERQAWKAGNNTEHTIALVSRVGCLQMESRFDEAVLVASRYRLEGVSDTLVTTARSAAALTFYMAGKYADAVSELQQLQFMVKDTLLTRESLFLMALAMNEQRRWQEADSVLRVMILRSGSDQAVKDSLLEVLTASYTANRDIRLKDPEVARKWSTFIPGAGHIYAGYVGEGVLNFTLQAAALGFIGYHIYIAHYLTAFTIGSGIFQHFYFGGINRAGFLAEKRNYRNLRDFNDPVRIQILEIQSLLYPS